MTGELFPAADISPGELRAATVDGLAVVVICTPDGEVHALRDSCPHQRAALSKGRLEEAVAGGSAGEYARSGEFIVRCPWHRFEFDVKTGRCLADPEKLRVRVYDVSVVDGNLILNR